MIEIIATAIIVAPSFYVLGAVMAKGAMADELDEERQAYIDENDFANLNVKAKNDAISAHTRCADALSTTHRKLSAIRDLINKPETVRKGVLASILDGDQ